MKTIAYNVNIDSLFEIQDKQLVDNNNEKERIRQEGIENKAKLLKIALPFIHGVFALHNRRCMILDRFGKRLGLLCYKKINIEEEINRIVNTEHDLIYKDNFSKLIFPKQIHGREISIWLHKEGKYQHNSDMDYSMTSFNREQRYGNSIEEELQIIAKHCAMYTYEW